MSASRQNLRPDNIIFMPSMRRSVVEELEAHFRLMAECAKTETSRSFSSDANTTGLQHQVPPSAHRLELALSTLHHAAAAFDEIKSGWMPPPEVQAVRDYVLHLHDRIVRYEQSLDTLTEDLFNARQEAARYKAINEDSQRRLGALRESVECVRSKSLGWSRMRVRNVEKV